MKKKEQQVKELITQREALAILNMYRPTLVRYSEILGIKGKRVGRCLYYRREDIERIQAIKENIVSRAVSIVERATGKRVKLL